MVRAAAVTSLTVVSVSVAFVGLTSTATRVAAGTRSRRSSSRFATTSPLRKLMPVRLPPGLARLATRPSLTGSSAATKTMGPGCRLGRQRHSRTSERGDHCNLPANQVGRQRRQSIDLIFAPAVYDRDVLALDIAAILEATVKSAKTVRVRVRRLAVEKPDHRHRRLLRARRDRPRRRAAEQRDERATLHSITSSASDSTFSENLIPSVFAVLRLITNSNLVDCKTGKSAGLAPLSTCPV